MRPRKTNAPMIKIENLVKTFGAKRAVDGISFTVERGEVVGFLGPNGSGKSTTMRMITGYYAPDSGKVSVGGHDVVESPLEAKRLIGYLPENAAAYADMTVHGFLGFAAELRGLSGLEKKRAVARAVERCFLSSVLHQSIDTLSKGYRHRTCLAQALIHDPEVLVLDEPTDGLDPNQKFMVRNMIKEMAPEKAIVISTHILGEVETETIKLAAAELPNAVVVFGRNTLGLLAFVPLPGVKSAPEMARIVLIVTLSAVTLATVSGAQAPAARTTKERVYSATQAARGEQTYMSTCVSCHPPATYKGAVFLNWQGRTLGDLLEVVVQCRGDADRVRPLLESRHRLLLRCARWARRPRGGPGLRVHAGGPHLWHSRLLSAHRVPPGGEGHRLPRRAGERWGRGRAGRHARDHGRRRTRNLRACAARARRHRAHGGERSLQAVRPPAPVALQPSRVRRGGRRECGQRRLGKACAHRYR